MYSPKPFISYQLIIHHNREVKIMTTLFLTKNDNVTFHVSFHNPVGYFGRDAQMCRDSYLLNKKDLFPEFPYELIGQILSQSSDWEEWQESPIDTCLVSKLEENEQNRELIKQVYDFVYPNT